MIFDIKGKNGLQNAIAEKYGIEGVPTKIIIDQRGDVRFEDIGYSGVANDLVDELSGVIEILLMDNHKS